jgi:hypothetical protein
MRFSTSGTPSEPEAGKITRESAGSRAARPTRASKVLPLSACGARCRKAGIRIPGNASFKIRLRGSANQSAKSAGVRKENSETKSRMNP